MIKTVYLQTVPFCDLTWDMVNLEGEDDGFEEWIAGNRSYWTRDAERHGYIFDDTTPICFEIFELTEVF